MENSILGDVRTDTLQEQGIRKPSLMQSGLIYTLCVVLLVFGGSRLQNMQFYWGALLTEIVFIALPPVLMLYLCRYDVKAVLRWKPVGPLNLFMVFWAMIFAMPVVLAFNYVNLLLWNRIFGRISVNQPPLATGGWGILLSILVIGVSAGVCEEILFRGTIMRSFERLGMTKAILISGFLFGLMHLDFQKLLGTFLLGCLIGFIVYRTGSLAAGMFAHFSYNTVTVLLTYGLTRLAKTLNTSGVQNTQPPNGAIEIPSLTSLPAAQLIAVVVVYGFLIIGSAIILIGLLMGLVKNTQGIVEPDRSVKRSSEWAGILAFVPGLLIIAFLYFAKGTYLLGVKIPAVDQLVRIMGG